MCEVGWDVRWGGVGWYVRVVCLLCSGEEQQVSTDTAAGLQPKSLKCDE